MLEWWCEQAKFYQEISKLLSTEGVLKSSNFWYTKWYPASKLQYQLKILTISLTSLLETKLNNFMTNGCSH